MKHSMKRFILALALLLALGAPVAAQTPNINWNSGVFFWTWTQGTGGAAASFLASCGTAPGSYTWTGSVPYPTMEIALKTLVPKPGTPVQTYCAVQAVNTMGASAYSNEVPFVLGLPADAPTGAGVRN